jgi:Immunity protein 53
MDNFSWLEDWYNRQCDGDWEHMSGVKIESLDNPGWSVVIDLNGTRYDEVQSRDLLDERTDEINWIVCKIQDGKFQGYGGAAMLGKIVQAFRKWIEQY